MKIPTKMPRLKGYRFPREVVAYAVWAYHRFALSTAQQARACIYGHLKERITNELAVDRVVRSREAASGIVGGWRVGTVICRGLEPVL